MGLFGAALATGLANRGDIVGTEDLELGEKEDCGEGGTKEVGDGAAEPDTRETLVAGTHEEGWHKEHEGNEEEDLSREAGNDGYPGLVDGLEELRIDNGVAYERAEDHEIAHGGDGDGDELLVGGEAAYQGLG